MEQRAYNSIQQKVTDRIKKLYSIGSILSNKDTSAVSYIVEKSMKVATVTFLLADVLDNETELARELQKTSIGLVSTAAKSTSSQQAREQFLGGLRALALLLEVAGATSKLSKMNTETVCAEIVDLMEFVGVIEWHQGRRYLDSEYFIDKPDAHLFVSEPYPQETHTYKSHVKDTYQRPVQQRTATSDLYTQREHREEKDTTETPVPHFKERIQEVQKDRRATILGILQKKDRVSVKDVALVIRDCSEKTLQRELLALVRQGVLKKEGERRWSTYSLASL